MEKNANFVVPDISVVPFEKIINDYKNIIKGMTAEEFDSSFCFRKIMAKAGYKKLEEVFADISVYLPDDNITEKKLISEKTIRRMYQKDMVHDFDKVFWVCVFMAASFEDSVKLFRASKINLQDKIPRKNIYDEKYYRNEFILQILYEMEIFDEDISGRVEEVADLIDEWRPFK